jgi:hypothetical protein
MPILFNKKVVEVEAYVEAALDITKEEFYDCDEDSQEHEKSYQHMVVVVHASVLPANQYSLSTPFMYCSCLFYFVLFCCFNVLQCLLIFSSNLFVFVLCLLIG